MAVTTKRSRPLLSLRRSRSDGRPKRRGRRLAGAFVVAGALVLGLALVTRGAGFSVHRQAWPGEARAAGFVRAWLLPAAHRSAVNPLPRTAETLRAGLEHWADHCATCHGNDGSGQTPVGRNLFPRAPDMRGPATQSQSDGALFYAIEHGVPFTGMPGWSTGTASGERASWELVWFIRHLPDLTPAELTDMERLNPKSAADRERERQIEDFLKGK